MSVDTKPEDKVAIPKAFKFLFKPARLKVMHGGRGGAKSESVARYLLLEGMENPIIILCAREYQNSIKDSVHQLLSDIIANNPILRSFYEVLKTEIRGRNGTIFIFAGLRHNIANIKSMHNVKKCWVEEGETVSDMSWKVLFPTIRAEDSEILVTFNPDIADSPTYQRMVVNPPPFAVVKKVSYRDNPYFPDVLEQERAYMEKNDPVAYDNVWEGNPKSAVEGAIFAEQIRKMDEDGRFTDVPYDPSVPVCTYWDIGKNAMTAIWFIQYVGMQWRVLRHYSNRLQELEHYLKYVQNQEYVYDMHYLPHDGEQKRLGMKDTVTQQTAKVLKNVKTVPRIAHKADAINLAQQVFRLCVFDKTNCPDGVNDLRRYAYKINEETGKISSEPETNTFYRDTADAFMTFAQVANPPLQKDELELMLEREQRMKGNRKSQSTAWWV